MSKNQISKKEIESIMSSPGELKGAIFEPTAEYIRYKYGKEGIKNWSKK